MGNIVLFPKKRIIQWKVEPTPGLINALLKIREYFQGLEKEIENTPKVFLRSADKKLYENFDEKIGD